MGWVVVCVGNKEAGENGMQLPNTGLANSAARLNGIEEFEMMQVAMLHLCRVGL